jgi:hypothetical protein
MIVRRNLEIPFCTADSIRSNKITDLKIDLPVMERQEN